MFSCVGGDWNIEVVVALGGAPRRGSGPGSPISSPTEGVVKRGLLREASHQQRGS